MSKYMSEKKTVPVRIISRTARREPSRMSAAVILFSKGQMYSFSHFWSGMSSA